MCFWMYNCKSRHVYRQFTNAAWDRIIKKKKQTKTKTKTKTKQKPKIKNNNNNNNNNNKKIQNCI